MNSDIFLVTAYAVPGAFVMIVLLACVFYESVSRRFEVNTYKDVVILFMSAFAPVVNIIMLGALIIVFGLSVMKNVDLSKKLHPTEKE